MPSRARLFWAGLALALAPLTLPAPAGAQAAGELGFSLVPDTAERYFIFDARPGQTVVGRLGVVSHSKHPQTVALRTVDVGTAVTGGLDYGLGRASGVGKWLTLARRRLTLAPGEVVSVPFKARIPEHARAGDHLAGLVAYAAPRRSTRSGSPRPPGPRLAFRSRLAVAVHVRLPGRRTPRLEFRDAAIVESPSGVRIQVRLGNTGNTLVARTRGHLKVSQGGQELLDAPVDIDTFAPDSEVSYPLLLPGTPVQGTYHLEGTLQPAGAAPIRISTDVELTRDQASSFEGATGTAVVRPPSSSRMLWVVLPLLFAAVFAGAYMGARR